VMKPMKGIFGCILASMLLFGTCGASCNNNHGKVTPAPPVVTDQGDCQAACDHMKDLGCVQANPTEMGTTCKFDSDCKGPDGNWDHGQSCAANGRCIITCTNFCIATENQGVWLDPTCVKNITSCDQIDQCPLPQKPAPSCTGPACPTSGHK
jgi:hypothetical protein